MVEVLERPLHAFLALGAHGIGVVEVAVDDVVADDVPEVRADLVRSALLEGVAGLALGDVLRTVVGAGGLEPVGDRGDLGLCRCLALALAGFRHRDHVAGLFGDARRVDRLGDDTHHHDTQRGAEHGAGNLVEFEVHLPRVPAARPTGASGRRAPSAAKLQAF